MAIEEVIRLGKVASHDVDISMFALPSWAWWTLSILLVITIICLLGAIESSIMFTPVWVFIILCVIIYNGYQEDSIVNEKVDKWEVEVAKPYIESLPIERREIVFIKIDPELSHDVKGSAFFGSGYTYSEEIQRTPLTISFKENGLTTLTNWYETQMELTEEEKPYVEYQNLPKGLGNGVDKGMYNVKVHLPESYEFTDIK